MRIITAYTDASKEQGFGIGNAYVAGARVYHVWVNGRPSARSRSRGQTVAYIIAPNMRTASNVWVVSLEANGCNVERVTHQGKRVFARDNNDRVSEYSLTQMWG